MPAEAMPAEPAYVPAMSPVTPITAEDLLRVAFPGKRVELVRGVLLVREPAGLPHGRITLNLARRLADHAETNPRPRYRLHPSRTDSHPGARRLSRYGP